jgi:hypothetical protein
MLTATDPSSQRRVHRARDGLDEHGLLVGQLLRHHVQLAAVGRELLAPSASGVRAETGLQPGLDVPDGDPVAAVGETGAAGFARVDAARGALQDRVDDDPGTGREVDAVGEQLGDRLVPGDQRQ